MLGADIGGADIVMAIIHVYIIGFLIGQNPVEYSAEKVRKSSVIWL